MRQRFSLQLVLDLAVRDAEAQVREVKRSHGEWLRARGYRVHLLSLRDERVAAMATQLRPGLSAEALRAQTHMLTLQHAELAQAAQRIDATYQTWQALLTRWMHAQDRVKALRVLEQRHIAARGIQLRRQEQRQHDELAQNTRFWRAENEGVA